MLTAESREETHKQMFGAPAVWALEEFKSTPDMSKNYKIFENYT